MEVINPILTKAQPSERSARGSLSEEDQRKIQFSGIISPCLHLVAPISMGDGERKLWMKAAYAALREVPFDLLAQGAKAAMATCTHTSKIVPTILENAQEAMRWRRERNETHALPAPQKDEYIEDLGRDLLDRMQSSKDGVLAAIRDVGLKAKFIYLGADGKLHQAVGIREMPPYVPEEEAA